MEYDLLAIRALTDRFNDAADRRDPAAMAAVYAPDGKWHFVRRVVSRRGQARCQAEFR